MIEKNKLITNIKSVSKIYHIADVHIRLLKRHNEYREVFNRLYEYINNTKDENSIICLLGDVVHSKTDMSPECFQMQADLYTELSKLCPLIIITGNHDCNLNNLSRLDSIEPVVLALNNSNIYYLKNTGLYDFADITFSVMSVFDKIENYIMANQFDSPNKIAMFHGAVRSAETDIGYIISDNDITTSLFTGYDITLLGDIHMPDQSLNKEQTIKYCGSLVQQNHGESLLHGILVWDVKNRKSDFAIIENDYGYYTLNITDGDIITENWKRDIPKKSRLRLIVENTDSADIKNILSDVRKYTDIVELTQRNEKAKSNKFNQKIEHDNLSDVNYQNQLIYEYLKINYSIDDSLFENVKQINIECNAQLPTDELVKNQIWTPISFEFSNMFSYGENNKIDFQDMKGFYGIFSGNTMGKCVDPSTEIEIEFDYNQIIQIIGYIPEELL